MAKHSSHILEMARKGAGHRLEELQAEIVSLIKSFPHLKSSGRMRGRKPQIDLSAVPAAMLDQQSRRKRKPMSAAARKAVSARMKAYWAARRAGKKK